MSLKSPLPKVGKTEVIRQIKEANDLPTLPAIAQQILAASRDDHTGAEEMMQIMVRDQAVTARVLKLANSAYYARSTTVTDLKQAIPLLGFDEIKRIALSLSVARSFPSRRKIAEFPLEGFWVHSTAVADIARELLKGQDENLRMLAYTAGLMHDVGKLLTCQLFPRHFFLIVHYCQNHRLSMQETEQAVMGLNHGIIGEMLCLLWKMPDVVRMAVRHHHFDDLHLGGIDITERVITAVNIADTLVLRAGVGMSGSPLIPEYDRAALTRLGRPPEEIETLEEQVGSQRDRYKMMFSDMG